MNKVKISRKELDEVRAKIKALQEEQDSVFKEFADKHELKDELLVDCVFDMLYNDFGINDPDHPVVRKHVELVD